MEVVVIPDLIAAYGPLCTVPRYSVYPVGAGEPVEAVHDKLAVLPETVPVSAVGGFGGTEEDD